MDVMANMEEGETDFDKVPDLEVWRQLKDASNRVPSVM